MRTVAILLALASLVAIFPTTTAAAPNQCVPDGTRSFCAVIPAEHSALSSVPYADKYYVWVGPGYCLPPNPGASPFSDECNGYSHDNNGVPVPPNYTTRVALAVFGVLWQETNGAEGLQRKQFNVGGQPLAPDRLVLV